MEIRTLAFGTALAALSGMSAAAGVTFDFEAASRKLFPRESAAAGANMLEGVAWSTATRISTHGIPNNDPRRDAVKKAAVYKHEGDVWSAEMPDSVIGVCGESLAKVIVSSWTASVKLSDTNGGPYRLSFLYDMRHTLGYLGQAFILFRANGRNMSHVTEGLSNIEAGGFPYQRDLAVPKGADEVMVIIRLDGVGRLSFSNPSLMPSPPERPVVLQLGAQGFFDSRFEISEGQPGLLSWLWKRGHGSTWDIRDFACRLVVPSGFRLVGVSFTDMKDAKSRVLPDGSVEYSLSCDGWLRPKAQFSTWHRAGAMVVAEGKAGSSGRLSFTAVRKDGTSLSDTSVVDLVAVERIKARMPKRFVGGICPSGHDWLCGPEADKTFARFLADTGTAGILKHSGDGEAHTKAYRDAGIREILRGDSALANGFCIGPAKGRPEDEKYVFLGKNHRYAANSACPVSIYTESEFFRTVTVPWMKRRTEGTDGFWANWEPYPYAGQGCMCGKCRAAFAKYVGVSDEEMARDWPQELAPRGKWDGKIQRFRSIEHGKVVKTIAKHINFIPGIFWGEMSSVWRPRNLACEVQAIDYAQGVNTICPWGPYVYWNTQTPYAPRKAPCLTTFCAAKDVRETVDKDYPAGGRPRLMGFPSGCSYGTDWVAQPEWIEIQQESFFFNGWGSSYPAGFPRGYDARYWRAFARANEMAAKYEDFVYDGRRVDAAVTVVPSRGERPFGSMPRGGSYYLDWMTNGVSHVQHVAYRLGKRAIVAVFNFSDTADTRVDIVVGGKVRNASVPVPACSCRVVELGGGRPEAVPAASAGGAESAERVVDLGRVRIDVPPGADGQVEMAVAELKTLLAEKSGSEFAPDAPFRFVFGRPEGAPEAAPFESRYRVDGDTVWLWGDDGGSDEIWDWGDDRGRESQRRKGSLFAVELFAEERLGFNWAWPGPDGTAVEKTREVRLPVFAEGRFETALVKNRIRNYPAYKPFAREQVISLMPPGLYEDELNYPMDHAARAAWQNRHRLQDREFFTYGHAFTDWHDRFSKTHPEYLNYRVADGSRGWTGSANKKSVKLCVSNPAVADQIVADWLAAGTNRYLNICENDGVFWCECDACRALDEPRASIEDLARNKAHLSDRYATFWNAVAGRARAHRPDVQVVTYAYSAYRYPPVRVKIEYPDNMVFGFVSGETDDGVGMVRRWQAAGMRRFFFRPNHLHYMGTIHRGYEKRFYDEFHAMLGLGMIGCDYDANVNRATTAIEFYVMAKAIADPTLGFEEIVSGFYAAYGAAAPDVRRYYEAVRATSDEVYARIVRERREQPEFFAEARKDVPRTQEFGRSEEELLAKKAILDGAVARHAAAGDLSDAEMRRLRNLALQAEHGVLTYRFLVSVTDMPVDEMKARAKALNDFRVANNSDLPDLYTKIYRIWWGEIRYWKIYFRRCSSESVLKRAGL